MKEIEFTILIIIHTQLQNQTILLIRNFKFKYNFYHVCIFSYIVCQFVFHLGNMKIIQKTFKMKIIQKNDIQRMKSYSNQLMEGHCVAQVLLEGKYPKVASSHTR